MKIEDIRTKVRKMWMGVALIVVAALLTVAINFVTYTYTKRTVSWQTAERTSHDLKELQRINDLKARVESAVIATVSTVEGDLQDRQEIYKICSQLVSRNQHIIGSAVALRPGFYSDADSAFAAFAFQVADDAPVTTKILPYDYETWEWYERPMKKDTIWWSQPYRDTGGSNMLIYTFSAPIHNSQKKCIGVLTGDINYKEMVFQNGIDEVQFDRVRLWALLSQLVSIALILLIVWRSTSSIRKVNALMTTQKLLTQELEIAGRIQNTMLPKASIQEDTRHHLDISVKLLSTSDIGGDFYDYFYAGHSLVFCIGDVPGCNIRASLLMAITRSVFRTAASASETPSPTEIVKSMNKSLCSITYNEVFITLLVGVLDLDTLRLTCCNAGHPCPMTLGITSGARTIELPPNVPIGILDDYPYEERQTILVGNSTLFFFTDGLYETENAAHQTFGMKRLTTRLNKLAQNQEPPKKIIDRLTEDVEKFRGSAKRIDDAVMVVIKTDYPM